MDLTLLMDQGPDQPGPRWRESAKFQSLGEILRVTSEPLVILGAPGSGKSTLLRHFELENAQAALAELELNPFAPPSLTFFIQLNDFKGPRPEDPPPLPLDWLSERWSRQNPDLPALPGLLRDGRMILLLDALNEMPYRGADVSELWRKFLADLDNFHSKARVIFSSRFLDYGGQLSDNDRPVVQARIEALSGEKVREFLQHYSPEHGETLWANSRKNPALLDAFRYPYFLKMLIEISDGGEIPNGRAALFTAFVRRLLIREIKLPNNELFQAGELLDERDIERLTRAARGKTPYELPQGGLLIRKLCSLAFHMQKNSNSRESGLVKIDYDRALELLDGNDKRLSRKLLEAGGALGVLEQDFEQDQVFYSHQLLQEYFAAQHFTRFTEIELAGQPWQAEAVIPDLQTTLDELADSDPLPPLPVTGWEETLLLASAMMRSADDFIVKLIPVNLPLAGRCAAQADVMLSAQVKRNLQQALLQRSQDSAADLRARIAAGNALGELGDPRFEVRQGPHGRYLLPPMIAIPGGVYSLGSDEGLYDREAPTHRLTLDGFQCGQFQVTNAEWRLFMESGGYEDQRWWISAAAKAWRSGANTDAGPKQQWRNDRKYLQDNFTAIREWVVQGRITSQQADDFEETAQWDDTTFEKWLNDTYPGGRLTAPAQWHDGAFNQPAQPVVGVCWHEAQAYCAWLSAQSGLNFRLPSEAEWEAAARGAGGRRFAYGDSFDNNLANTFECHIHSTTPIGVFSAGATPEGLQDMTGNVWEWTGSLYRTYPYHAGDGRENPETGDGRRVARGGSWFYGWHVARAAFRSHLIPGDRGNSLGFRLWCSPPIKRTTVH